LTRRKRFNPGEAPVLTGHAEARRLLAVFLAAVTTATFSVSAVDKAAAEERSAAPVPGGASFEAAIVAGVPPLTLDQLSSAGEIAFAPEAMVSKEFQQRRSETFLASITSGSMLASVPLPDAVIAGVGGDELAAAYEDELSGSDDSAIPAPETEPGVEYASRAPEENADEPLKSSEQSGDLPFHTSTLGGAAADPEEIAASSPEDYVPEQSQEEPSAYEDDLSAMGIPEEPAADEEADDGEEDAGLSQ
jgi:hypothetical protein